MNYKKAIFGSSIALIIATSCCWLPALIIAIGGGSTLMAFSSGIEKLSGIFMAIGLGLLGFGAYSIIYKFPVVSLILFQVSLLGILEWF